MQDIYEEPHEKNVENSEEAAGPEIVEEDLVCEVPDNGQGVQAIGLALYMTFGILDHRCHGTL